MTPTTPSGHHYTGDEYQRRVDAMYRSLLTRMDRQGAGLVLMEQRLHWSKDERICAQCGDAGAHKQAGGGWGPFACVSHYWLCEDCHAYYASMGTEQEVKS